MDPKFAAAFSSEDPEGYSEAIRSKKRRAPTADPSVAVHVPVIPQYLSRFVAGVAVMLVLIGGIALLSQTVGMENMSIPSGQLLNDKSGAGVSVLSESEKDVSTITDPNSDLGQRVAPIGEAGSNFFEDMVGD